LYRQKVIIDEAQKVPHLFSYIQGIVDEDKIPGQFILSGSQNFLLHKNITQSLAGRVAVLRLLPFDFQELNSQSLLPSQWEEAVFKGFYPRLYDQSIMPREFYNNYVETYVERDVEEIVNIRNVKLFRTFVRLCAGRIGQVLNLSSLASDCGISHSTAREWLSLLEGSYIVFTLAPYYRNFNKRLIKSPKLYFYDTGLAASLLDILEATQIQTHYLMGGLFENLILAELHKRAYHHAAQPNMYFWRDSNGNEMDCLISSGQFLDLVEIKAGRTVNAGYFKGFSYFQQFASEVIRHQYLIYGGKENQPRTDTQVLGWQHLDSIG
jgi:predicted AAA+ superfamily ATPase